MDFIPLAFLPTKINTTMINFHINSTEVTDLVTKTGVDRYTAMAMLSGWQFGITPQEEAEYMRLFHANMSARLGVLTSISNALVAIALSDEFMQQTVEKCKQSPFSLN